MRLKSLIGVAFACGLQTIVFAYPGDAVEWIQLKAFNSRTNPKWGAVLTDIMQHEAPGDSDNYDDLVTLGHETSHGIHAYIRNHLNTSGQRMNGFYVLDNRAVLVKEPNLRKRDVAPYVPKSLQGYRYAQYVTGQTAWDDTPLYLYDEWNAYVNGGASGVDLVNNNLWNYPWRDAVSGVIEFSAYALATGMAVRDRDPNYFQSYVQFKEFLAFNLRRSMAAYLPGSAMGVFQWQTQDDYFNSLKTSPDAEKLRQFCRDTFGTSWCYEVLGIQS
jgi:hypothetical protein